MDKELLKDILQDCGVTLYDTEMVTEDNKKIFRVFITSSEGISLEKCTQVTKIISPILDTNPPIYGEYLLEVSSPGIERKLKTIEHFQNSIGELVKLKLSDSSKIKGKLLKVEQDTIFLHDKSTKQERKIKYSDIIKAKTYFQW